MGKNRDGILMNGNGLMKSLRVFFIQGGKGSGNFGHKGRPGQVGGSQDQDSTNDNRRIVGRFRGKPILSGSNYLSKEEEIKEVNRVAPLLKKVGNTWKKEILKHDNGAKVEVRGTWKYLDRIKWDEFLSPHAWISAAGTTSDGEHFGLSISLYPDGDGNILKMDDSSLPDSLQRKGIFSSGIYTLANMKGVNLSGKASVHHSTNDKAWMTIFNKFGFNWKEWQE